MHYLPHWTHHKVLRDVRSQTRPPSRTSRCHHLSHHTLLPDWSTAQPEWATEKAGAASPLRRTGRKKKKNRTNYYYRTWTITLYISISFSFSASASLFYVCLSFPLISQSISSLYLCSLFSPLILVFLLHSHSCFLLPLYFVLVSLKLVFTFMSHHTHLLFSLSLWLSFFFSLSFSLTL